MTVYVERGWLESGADPRPSAPPVSVTDPQRKHGADGNGWGGVCKGPAPEARCAVLVAEQNNILVLHHKTPPPWLVVPKTMCLCNFMIAQCHNYVNNNPKVWFSFGPSSPAGLSLVYNADNDPGIVWCQKMPGCDTSLNYLRTIESNDF